MGTGCKIKKRKSSFKSEGGFVILWQALPNLDSNFYFHKPTEKIMFFLILQVVIQMEDDPPLRY